MTVSSTRSARQTITASYLKRAFLCVSQQKRILWDFGVQFSRGASSLEIKPWSGSRRLSTLVLVPTGTRSRTQKEKVEMLAQPVSSGGGLGPLPWPIFNFLGSQTTTPAPAAARGIELSWQNLLGFGQVSGKLLCHEETCFYRQGRTVKYCSFPCFVPTRTQVSVRKERKTKCRSYAVKCRCSVLYQSQPVAAAQPAPTDNTAQGECIASILSFGLTRNEPCERKRQAQLIILIPCSTPHVQPPMYHHGGRHPHGRWSLHWWGGTLVYRSSWYRGIDL